VKPRYDEESGGEKIMRERRMYPRYSVKLPLEYWETHDAARGGLVANVSEAGALIYSIEEMNIGEVLKVRISFTMGCGFESFDAVAKIIWKAVHSEANWRGYEYGLEFSQMSWQGHQKLREFLTLQAKQRRQHGGRELANSL
jgi:hypothetical protein